MALPLFCSEWRTALGFDAELQELYAAVVSHGNAQKRKLSEDPTAEEFESTAKEPELTLNSPDGGSASSQPPGRDDKQGNNGEAEKCGAKMADRPKRQQSLPVTSGTAERPASKPKKKKVGLFR